WSGVVPSAEAAVAGGPPQSRKLASAAASTRFNRDSVADGEAVVDVLRLLYLIEHRHREVFHRDRAAALRVGHQLLAAEAELAGTRAGADVARGTEIGPGDAVFHFRAQPVERIHCGAHLAVVPAAREGVDDALA